MNTKFLKYFCIFILLILFSQYSLAQNRGKCPPTKNRKSKELYQDALNKQGINSKSALKSLKSAIRNDNRFIDAYYLYARINYDNAERTENTKVKKVKYQEAIKYFKKTINICKSFDDYKSYFYIAKAYYNEKEYKKSKPFFENFIKLTPAFVQRGEAQLMLDNVNEYIDLVNNPIDFKPYKLPGISSNNDEYLPTLSPDNEQFFYTRKITDNTGNYKEYFNTSIKTSKRGDSKEVYTYGFPLPTPFNDGRNQGGASLTVDNQNLYFTVCGIERTSSNSYINCDIYHATKIAGKWNSIKKMSDKINGNFSFEGQPTITPNGNTIYFASYRADGYGGIDIYCAHKNKNGKWGDAYNLGPQINTSGDDKTPFIHPDSKTLYFASNGRFGMGGFDIFYSTLLNNGWTKPKNIGYPINTENDELAFAVSTDGNRLYFSSNTLTSNKTWNIYSSQMPTMARPQQVLLVKGKIQTKEGDTISEIKVVVKSLLTHKTTNGFADKITGDYALSVPVEKNEKFVLTAKKKGYIYNSIFIDPTQKDYYPPPTTKNIKILKIKKGTTKILTNVNFEFDSFQLTDTSKIALDDLVAFLKDNNKVKIEVSGHTDNVGTPSHNFTLSYKRAQAVTNYLIINGIENYRLKFKAFGEAKPLTSNKNENGRAINRRVEFMIL